MDHMDIPSPNNYFIYKKHRFRNDKRLILASVALAGKKREAKEEEKKKNNPAQ